MGFWQNVWSRILRVILSWILPIPQQQPSSSSSNNNNGEVVVDSNNKHLLAIAKCLKFAKSSRTSENNGILSLQKAAVLIRKVEESEEEAAGDHKKLPEGLKRELMPRHVAVILDGNRRWAKKRGHFSSVEGYEAGLLALGEFMRLCEKWDIPVISLFLFSSENWSRPQVEVDYLMETFEQILKDEHNTFVRIGARVSAIGDTSLLPISLQETITQVEEDTKKNTKLQVLLAMSYSGQNDIEQACKSIATKVKEGTLNPEDVTKTLIEQELQTKVADIPCPDLLIRTSGELRISNYYLWQSAYTELYFADVLWPDFGEADFAQALGSYQKRGRRFGKK